MLGPSSSEFSKDWLAPRAHILSVEHLVSTKTGKIGRISPSCSSYSSFKSEITLWCSITFSNPKMSVQSWSYYLIWRTFEKFNYFEKAWSRQRSSAAQYAPKIKYTMQKGV